MIRKKITIDGKLFMIYLILSGAARFAVEFIRVNPRILFGLSEAQLIACTMMLIGIFGWKLLSNKPAQSIPAA